MNPHITQTASSRALALPEIVTSIMQQMDMRTLITSQRVCRTWSNIIQTSRSLQQALFLLSDQTAKNASKPRVYNPLLAETFPSFFPSAIDTDSIQRTTLTTLPFLKSPKTLKAHLRPEASWRHMLITQPPIHIIGRFICGSRKMGQTWHEQKAAPQKEGLRMGKLFEMTIQLRRYEWNNCETWISLGEEAPVNAPAEMKKPSIYLDVLLTGGHMDCTEFEGPEDPDWVNNENKIVWEEIRACYKELGVSLVDIPMEEYNEGWASWN